MQIIETFIPITQAKAKFLDMVRQLHDTNWPCNQVLSISTLQIKIYDGSVAANLRWTPFWFALP